MGNAGSLALSKRDLPLLAVTIPNISDVRIKPMAAISVADTGVGIPPEEIPRLFVRFGRSASQKPSTNKPEIKKEKSIGLGLFLAKNLVQKMGGEIFVESQLGKGSKFTFTLPLSTDSK